MWGGGGGGGSLYYCIKHQQQQQQGSRWVGGRCCFVSGAFLVCLLNLVKWHDALVGSRDV